MESLQTRLYVWNMETCSSKTDGIALSFSENAFLDGLSQFQPRKTICSIFFYQNNTDAQYNYDLT